MQMKQPIANALCLALFWSSPSCADSIYGKTIVFSEQFPGLDLGNGQIGNGFVLRGKIYVSTAGRVFSFGGKKSGYVFNNGKSRRMVGRSGGHQGSATYSLNGNILTGTTVDPEGKTLERQTFLIVGNSCRMSIEGSIGIKPINCSVFPGGPSK